MTRDEAVYPPFLQASEGISNLSKFHAMFISSPTTTALNEQQHNALVNSYLTKLSLCIFYDKRVTGYALHIICGHSIVNYM